MSFYEITNIMMLVNVCRFIWFLPFLLLKQCQFFLTKYNMDFVPLETTQVFMFRFLKTSSKAGASLYFKVPVTLDSM